MSLVFRMSKGEMTAAAGALDQALYMHEQWCNNVYCSLICRLPADERDLSDDPHHRCPFGQWYYSQQNASLSRHPGFIAVSSEHELVHRIAASMLGTSQDGGSIPVREYENFLNTITRMRAEIVGLRHELEEGITSLDPLTGATGRIAMLANLRAQQQMVRRKLHACAIAMMDLDSFKSINDRYGHQAGDIVLINVVRNLMTQLRPYDELYRYGGDEFLLCIPGDDLAAGIKAVERLRNGIEATPIDAGGQALQVTASFGVTLLDPDIPVEESIARCDRALYRAKAEGRNQTRAWTGPGDE